MEYPKKVRCIKAATSLYTKGKIYGVTPRGRIIDDYGDSTTHVYYTTTLNPDGDRFPRNSDFELVDEIELDKQEEKVMEKQRLSRKGLKEIHGVACGKWKTVLGSYGFRNPFEDYVELTHDEVNEMFKACTKEQLPIVSKYLKQDDGTFEVKNVQGRFIGLDNNDLLIALRTNHEYGNKSFWLNSDYNWEIKRDTDNVLCLIPTKKK